MSPFVIFVIVLTIIYIIYYAVMITRDLYGKKEDHKTQEEVFDVSDMVEEEAAVSVHESDNGFSVADKEYETLNLHDENEAPSSTDGESGDAKSEKQSPKNVAENLAHKFEKKSDEIQPSMSDGMYADDFYQTLLNGNRTNRPQIKMNRTLVIGAVALTSIVFVGCKEKPYQLPKLEAIRAAEGARRNWLLMDDTHESNIDAQQKKVDTVTTDSLIQEPILMDSMTKDSL